MSTWTWTYVKIDKLTKDQTEKILKYALWLNKGSVYYEYLKIPFEDALKQWIDSHKEHYDYYVNTCKVSPDKLTDEYLENKLKEKLNDFKFKTECYEKVLNGELSFVEMLEKTNQLKEHSNDFYIIKRNDNYYINIRYEIFRNRKYTDEEFYTVDRLIEFLKDPMNNMIMDFSLESKDRKYDILTPELEKKIREYYSSIGDNNFYVHFG